MDRLFTHRGPGPAKGRCAGAGISGLAVSVLLAVLAAAPGWTAQQRAHFAGGCFWCVEADLEKLPGVTEAISGFTGGSLPNPTYRGNHEGHYEAVEVRFDDSVISYDTLLRYFLRHIDPLDDGGQFCDRGFSYRTAVFVDEAQRPVAEKALADAAALFPDDAIATEILPQGRFWPVEDYHQDYAEKNPLRYKYYRWNCGRDRRVDDLWEDKSFGRLPGDSAEH